MKKRIICIALCLLCAGTVFSQKKMDITAGGMYWLSFLDYVQGESGVVTVDPAHNFAPMLKLRYGPVSLQAHIFFADYQFLNDGFFDFYPDPEDEDDSRFFDEFSLPYDSAYYALRIENYRTTFSRTELNATLGYRLSENLVLYGTYRQITMKWKQTDIHYDLYEYDYEEHDYMPMEDRQDETAPFDRTDTFYFFGPGLDLTVPFGSMPFAFDASIAYLFPARNKDNEITSIQGGFSYHAPFGLNCYIGYYAQLRSIPDQEEYEKTIHGPIASLSFTLGFIEE